MDFKQWTNFNAGDWKKEIDVRDFIQKNYTPYEGDSNFLANPSEKTKKAGLPCTLSFSLFFSLYPSR